MKAIAYLQVSTSEQGRSGLGRSQKSGLEIGLKLGRSKSVQRHASYGVKINPMGLWCLYPT